MQEETEAVIPINKKEYQKLKRNYGTAKIIAVILIIGLLIIAGATIYEEQKFNKAMFKCREQTKELEECQNTKLGINQTYVGDLFGKS